MYLQLVFVNINNWSWFAPREKLYNVLCCSGGASSSRTNDPEDVIVISQLGTGDHKFSPGNLCDKLGVGSLKNIGREGLVKRWRWVEKCRI